MQARFDDLLAGRSFRLTDPVEEITAHRLDEVVPALVRAEAAARDGAWVAGAVTYEAAPAFDAALSTKRSSLPLAWFGVFSDRVDVAPPEPVDPPEVGWSSSVSAAEHGAAVAEIHRLIEAGITYQTNLTHRLHSTVLDPARLYAAMLHGQRPSFGAMLQFGETTIASASPELFFALDGDRIWTRPMKGTIGRGRWSAEDEDRRNVLAASEKDRAENLMIVDLLRNDLGRVAEFGSVVVDALFDIERYETVWQMTSTISARRRSDVALADIFEALFPCGSVTGAPKASTMRVIADLETSPRGVYCGAIGVIEPGGDRASFSVPIRTAVIADSGAATFGTGGGVTWDSSAAGEWREAELKTRVLTAAGPSFDLLETIRVDAAGFVGLGEHVERLQQSARYFGWSLDTAAVRRALEAVDASEASVVRLTVGRSGATSVTVRPMPLETGPVRLAIDREPIDRRDPFRFHKTTHRSMYDRSAHRFPSHDDVVAVNDAGEAVETTIGNLLVLIDGRWLTPPLDAGCLPGIARSRLILDGTAVEAPIPVDALFEAEAVQVVNSVRGRRRAVVDGEAVPRSRPTQR